MHKFNVFVSFVIILLITALSIMIGAIFFKETSVLDKKVYTEKVLENADVSSKVVVVKSDDNEKQGTRCDNECKTSNTQVVGNNKTVNNNKDVVVVLIENNVIDKTGKKQTGKTMQKSKTDKKITKKRAKSVEKKVVKNVSKKKPSKRVVKKNVPVSKKRTEKNKQVNQPVKRVYTDSYGNQESEKSPVKRNKNDNEKQDKSVQSKEIVDNKVVVPNKRQEEIKLVKKVKQQTPSKRNQKEASIKTPTKRQKGATKDNVVIKNVKRPERYIPNKEIIEIDRNKTPLDEGAMQPQEIHNIIKIEIDEDDNVDNTKTIDDSDIIEEETQLIKRASKQ